MNLTGGVKLFFAFVFALPLPFWLAGVLTTFQPLPTLTLSALMTVCPMAEAAIGVSVFSTRSVYMTLKPVIAASQMRKCFFSR